VVYLKVEVERSFKKLKRKDLKGAVYYRVTTSYTTQTMAGTKLHHIT